MAGKKAELVVKDHGWVELMKHAKEIKDSKVKVGVLDEGDGAAVHDAGGVLTVAEIAAIHEFGTQDGHIPERSFVRSTFDEKHEELVELGKELMKKVLEGKIPVDRALNVLGAKLATEIKKKITVDGVPPPNAESTVIAKGSSRPLVDTGRMVNAITWAIIGKGSSE